MDVVLVSLDFLNIGSDFEGRVVGEKGENWLLGRVCRHRARFVDAAAPHSRGAKTFL